MSGKIIPLSAEEHLEVADDLAMAAHYLSEACRKVLPRYPKSNKASKAVWALHPNALSTGNKFSALKNHLDDEYHRVANNAFFREHGHIYYNLEERYEKLQAPVMPEPLPSGNVKGI